MSLHNLKNKAMSALSLHDYLISAHTTHIIPSSIPSTIELSSYNSLQ